MTKEYGLLIPRSGLAGLWDRFIGPNATPAENTLIIASAIAGAAAAAWRLSSLGFDGFPLAVGAFLGFDVIGGAVCNTTDTTKRWYHRPEVTWIQHAAFILPHLAYIAAVAWLFSSSSKFDWYYFELMSAYLMVATAVVLAAPVYLKRPTATVVYLLAVGLGLYQAGSTSGMEWFVPALFLKLLVGHLVPEPLPRDFNSYRNSHQAALSK